MGENFKVGMFWIVVAAILQTAPLGADTEGAAPRKVWDIPSSEVSVLSTVVAQENLFVFIADGTIEKRDPWSGGVVWSVKTALCPVSTPAMEGSTVFAACDDGALKAWDIERNEIVWSVPNLSSQFSDVLIGEGRVYVGMGGERPGVIGVNKRSGRVVIRVRSDSPVLSPLSILGDRLFAASSTGEVLAVDWRAGTVVNALQTRGAFRGDGVLPLGSTVLIAPTGYHRAVECVNMAAGGTPGTVWSISFVRNRYVEAEEYSRLAFMRPQARSALLRKALPEAQVGDDGTVKSFVPTGPVYTSGWAADNSDAAVVVREAGILGQALYHVLLVDPGTGKAAMTYSELNSGTTYQRCVTPIVTPKSVIAAVGSHDIVGIDRQTETVDWRLTLDGVLADALVVESGVLVVQTHDGSVAAFRLPGAMRLPTAFMLYGSYPNPFLRTTAIRYALPTAADVALALYNARGQQVVTLERSRKGAGYHQVVWRGVGTDGKRVSAGTYYAKFRAGSYSRTLRLTLIE